jgi:hypothetical protein
MAQFYRGPSSKCPSPKPGCIVIDLCPSQQEFEAEVQHL